MKHIWCFDDYSFKLFEGYVMDDYKRFADDMVFADDTQKKFIGNFHTEVIFEDKEEAINTYKGAIGLERVKIHNKIEELKRVDEELFNRLLEI